ncbi:carboxypeptidase-like regulatory domain-containing protein [Chryseobacterium oryzae]|uniref:TonB-dependent receptor n=1 Tax=Chryseobacterium oryzae TaxID=2929799 RepID=A0ABY4BJP8_9FLAO|nr:carboxypeptidase-like regulatory domain-containing protein [Chryseobacterium oryzae]UOE39387.1 TonB-dependent receptor [Chryseobacterium oryzae]
MKYLFLLFSILFLKISAQTEVKGLVVSENKQAVSRANVILTDTQDNIITFVFSNKDGSFLLNTDKFGHFNLQISAMGFITKKYSVSIIKRGENVDFKTITLETDKVKEIKEVVISRTSPIKIKKDTIEYSAKSFSNGTEQNVEELLKKMPGIKVLNDGKIKFGNKEVSRVMVENDDLFEKGYQTLTQNMPSKPIDKIQVLKNYSKNKLLKNIENSEGIALNLTLKEDAKGKWFGNTILASTSYKENMRQGKLNIMNFTKRKKVYFLLNANNSGLNEMNGVEYLINPSSENDVENVGTNINTLSTVNLHQKNFHFNDKRTNFNNDRLASVNYIYNFETDWKLKFVTIFNEIENSNYITSYNRFNYQGLDFVNNEEKTWKQNNRNIVGKIEISKEFKKNANLQFYNKISSLNENNNNIFLFNEQLNNQIGKNELFATENRISYTKKIDSSRAFVAVGRYIFQNRPYNFTDENDVFSHILNNPDAKKVNQTINSQMNFGGVKLSFIKKYSEENNLEIQIGNEYRKDFLQSDLQVFNSDNIAVDFNHSGFVNQTDYLQNTAFGQLKFSKKNKKWNYGFSILNQIIHSDLNQNKNDGFYVSPTANVGYQNLKTGNFNINAGRRFSTISINDVYTQYIYQGSRNFRRNNTDFIVLPDYNFSFAYNLGDQLSQYLNFNINYFRSEDYLSNNMIVNPNYTFNQTILVKNSSTVSSNLEARKYLKFLKSRLSLLGSYMQSNYENSINNQPLINTNFINWKAGFEMKSGWTKWVNYELGYEWIFNTISSEVNSNKYINEKGFFNLYITVNPQLRIESFLEYYKFGNTNQKTTQFLDIKANYTSKKYNMSIFIQGNNLLNSNSIQQYSISSISESLYTQRLIPRHVILGINKSF